MKISQTFGFIFATATLALLAGCSTTSETAGDQDNTLGAIAKRLGVPFIGWWRGWSPSGDVNGEVGHPLNVNGPRGSDDCSSASINIASGQLPPGLSMGRNGDISGIPTQRGHWIVTMKIENLMCNGHHFTLSGAPDVLVENQGWTNQYECIEDGQGYCKLTTIRFHVTGSGQVVQ
jgi:hypothetical protein